MKRVIVDKMLKDVGYVSEEEREKFIAKYEEEERKRQLMKDKIKSRQVCGKW